MEKNAPLKAKSGIARRFNPLVKALPGGVVILDERGYICSCNDFSKELLEDGLLGKRWLQIIQEKFSPKMDDGHEVSLKNNKKVRIETNQLGDMPGQIILISDLTETRLLQESLSHHQKLSFLGKMMGKVAHQIRTPLSSALLYANNLKNARLEPERQEKFIDRLAASLDHLKSFVDELLLFVKKGNLLVSRVNAVDVFHSLSAQLLPLLSRTNSTIIFYLEKQAMPVLGNADALSSACANIIENAIEAKGSHAEIFISAKQESKQVKIKISDNGPGMEESLLKKIMEPFFTTKAQGTGLGLAVVHSIVKAHQGCVQVVSEVGRGTDFFITLPLGNE